MERNHSPAPFPYLVLRPTTGHVLRDIHVHQAHKLATDTFHSHTCSANLEPKKMLKFFSNYSNDCNWMRTPIPKNYAAFRVFESFHRFVYLVYELFHFLHGMVSLQRQCNHTQVILLIIVIILFLLLLLTRVSSCTLSMYKMVNLESRQ